MKKLFALGVVLYSVMLGASAAETRAYTIPNSYNPDGQTYCSTVWPGSQFFGYRQGPAPYQYILCTQ